MNNVKLLIACGNPVYGKELAEMLSRFDFIPTAVSLDDADNYLEKEDFSVLIFDINAPKSFAGTGIDIAKRLKNIKPIKAIGITMYFHSYYDTDLRNESMNGYILRSMSLYDIVEIIKNVISNEKYFSVPNKYKPKQKVITE